VLFKYTHTTNNSNMVHLQLTETFIGCFALWNDAHVQSKCQTGQAKRICNITAVTSG